MSASNNKIHGDEENYFLLLLVLINVGTFDAAAQVITVGVGNDGGTANAGTQVYPLGNYHGFERSASIYTSVQTTRFGIIRGIAWFAEEGGKGERPIKIYMRKLSSSTYGQGNDPGNWTDRINNAELVYEGVLTPVQGWNMITLDRPFNYDAQYLEVLVEANYGGTGNGGGKDGNKIRYSEFPSPKYPHATWKYDENMTIGVGERSNKRPEIQLDFTDNETIEVSGLNKDVIAEKRNFQGETSFDNVGNHLYSEDFNPWLLPNPPANSGLPTNEGRRELINRLANGPFAYKLYNYDDSNALQLALNETGNLSLTSPVAVKEIYLLHASGNGPTTIEGTITFEDNSTQSITSFDSPDWVTGTGNIAYQKRMRARNQSPGIFNFFNNDTKFFQTTLAIDSANRHKKITGITLTCTAGTSNNSRFNLMAISGKQTPKVEYVYENGSWKPEDPSGISTFSDNISIVNGETSLTENTKVRTLTVNMDATLKINHVLDLYGDINNNGELIFLSDATSNGELGPVPPTSTITGNATVHRYMSANRSYRLVSPTVTTTTSIHANWQEGVNLEDPNDTKNPQPGFGTHITGSTTGANALDATFTGNPSLFKVNPVQQQYEAVLNTLTPTLSAGDAYLIMVRGDRSIDMTDPQYVPTETILRATGTLHTGQHIQQFPAATVSDSLNRQFAMFGNPYQSAVDIKQVFANNSSNNINTHYYYIYDPTLATQGGWVTVDLDQAGNNTSGSEANQFLQPGQAAQYAYLGQGTSQIEFMEKDKAPGSHTQTYATGNQLSANNMLTVQLYTQENHNTGGPTHDSFGIIFDDAYTNEVTPKDAVKLMNFDENLAVDNKGTYLSVERREIPQPGEIYQIYSSGYAYIDYILKLMVDGLENNTLFLDDHYTGTSTLLEAGENTYTFSVDADNGPSQATDRFSIRTESRLDIEDKDGLAVFQLHPNPVKDNTFFITAPNMTGGKASVQITDMTGRLVYRTQVDANDGRMAITLTHGLNAGVYLVTVKQNGKESTQRLIKQ